MTTVIHVTEAFGGGVFQSVCAMARQQAASGANVTVIAARRHDTPARKQIVGELGSQVRYREVGGRTLIGKLIRLLNATRRATIGAAAVTVHAHSSFAGAAIRAIPGLWSGRIMIAYSPHGFSFLRQDLAGWKRTLLKLVERALRNNYGAMILVSRSEEHIARTSLKAQATVVVENVVDLPRLPERSGGDASDRLRIVTAGRVVYQKAPWVFSAIAERYSEKADFRWIGGGDSADIERWFGRRDEPRVTGWLGHEEVLRQIANADIFVMTSLWEGMPVALIEAQCVGVPAVVTDCVGNRDVVRHNETGFVVPMKDLAEAIGQMIAEPASRIRFGEAALRQRERFSEARLGRELAEAYETLAALSA